MGADIHLFIEYRRKNESKLNPWISLAGRIQLARNYYIFERLAGVRGDLANAIVQPRGFPDDASQHAKDENFLWINYQSKEPNPWAQTCTEEEAKGWVSSGRSQYLGVKTRFAKAVDLKGEKEPEFVAIEKPERVSDPTWHSHSWLTLEEFDSAIKIEGQTVPLTWAACLAAMGSLAANGCEVRVVFWFNN